MKANELRINTNILIHNYNTNSFDIHRVRTIDIELCLTKNEFFNKEFKPVPLTPELLKRCGFQWEDNQNAYFFKEDGGEIYVRQNFTKEYYLRYYDSENFEIKIEYLHELQNLIYCLTKIELELK